MIDVSNISPITPTTPKATKRPTKNMVMGVFSPTAPTSQAAIKAPTANREPWARFKIPITPRMMLNPSEVRNKKEAKYNPFSM